ncbi:unnamed protein product [Kuraishia capsulata CBS 1993]|uniref:Small ribosomal subunit protein uS7 domain-containing protein n=1 Tax=Kuraishia capsulata CBS 1993 TaxID=1382522 RepID=W6MLY3_9ASCO|nr:uncharacterized protein KUCA_T00003507001 [Kuraishia capsulata CBS 1993]CDK27529.1 unnamed protein product [Kuraishia capsulata CBS 1993]
MSRLLRLGVLQNCGFSQALTRRVAVKNLPLVSRRCQSTESSNAPGPASTTFEAMADKLGKGDVTSELDSDYDMWLTAIKEVREQFNSQPWDPKTLLASAGESEADLSGTKEFKWEPTEAQIAERDALIAKAIPKLQDDTLNICINIIMKHGKKEKARKGLSQALYHVYLHTREDPVKVLKSSLKNLTPLTETKVHKTGFAKNQVVPVLVTPRKGLILAFKWILEGANKRASSSLGVRLGEEILAVHSGKSSGFDKRAQLHKQAMLQRAHLKV